jgi:hypothetical protein
MNKGICLFYIFFTILIRANAQEATAQEIDISIDHRFSVGINGGIGYNSNAYRFDTDNNGFTYYSLDKNYSYGGYLGFLITKKIKARLELGFYQMSYGMNWNMQNSDFYKTETTLSYFTSKLSVDYLFLSGRKFQFFASPYLTSELLTDCENYNIFIDGSSNYKTYNLITKQYPKSILGLGASILAKYKVTEKIGVTLSTYYTYYLRNFVRANDKPYQRIGLNMGVEYSF